MSSSSVPISSTNIHHNIYTNNHQSIFSQAVGIVSVFFICTSILTFCLKTHPDMRVPIIHNLTVRVSLKKQQPRHLIPALDVCLDFFSELKIYDLLNIRCWIIIGLTQSLSILAGLDLSISITNQS